MRQLHAHVPNGCRSFRFKSIRYKFIRQFYVLGFKERRIFTQNVSLFTRTILEVNKIFVQFHFLSSYQNDRFPCKWIPPKEQITCPVWRIHKTYKLKRYVAICDAIWTFPLQSSPWLLEFPSDSFVLQHSVKWAHYQGFTVLRWTAGERDLIPSQHLSGGPKNIRRGSFNRVVLAG